jgi:hypothetical protein
MRETLRLLVLALALVAVRGSTAHAYRWEIHPRGAFDEFRGIIEVEHGVPGFDPAQYPVTFTMSTRAAGTVFSATGAALSKIRQGVWMMSDPSAKVSGGIGSLKISPHVSGWIITNRMYGHVTGLIDGDEVYTLISVGGIPSDGCFRWHRDAHGGWVMRQRLDHVVPTDRCL